MTAPDGTTQEQPAVEPSVSTAPAPGTPYRWWSAIPRHLGRARTSTLVMVVLFLAIGVLYLYVRPEETAADTTGGDPAVDQPATTTAPAPTTTVPVDPTTSEAATTDPPTESSVPEETTESVPEETTESVPAPTDETSSVPAVPTTSAPTG